MHRRELDKKYEQIVSNLKSILKWSTFWLFVGPVLFFLVWGVVFFIQNVNATHISSVSPQPAILICMPCWLLGIWHTVRKIIRSKVHAKFGIANALHLWLLFAYEVNIDAHKWRTATDWCHKNIKGLWDSEVRSDPDDPDKKTRILYILSRRTAVLVKLKFGGKE